LSIIILRRIDTERSLIIGFKRIIDWLTIEISACDSSLEVVAVSFFCGTVDGYGKVKSTVVIFDLSNI